MTLTDYLTEELARECCSNLPASGAVFHTDVLNAFQPLLQRCLRAEQERDQLRQERDEALAALGRAADTFYDFEKSLHLLGKPLAAEAARIAKEATRVAALSTQKASSESVNGGK